MAFQKKLFEVLCVTVIIAYGTLDCFITNNTKCAKSQWCMSLSIGATKSKELSPNEIEPADTPDGNDESPNDTGTAIKNPASREPTPQLRGPIKKRLVH